MGKRGPPKTPTAQLEARGSWRASDRKDAEMPEGLPEAPGFLTAGARVHWFRLLPLLATARVLRQTDGNALGRYCLLLDRWLTVEAWLATYGMFREVKTRAEDENKIPILDAEGNETFVMVLAEEWPQTKTASRLAEQLTRLEDRFGLNPSARASVGSNDKPAADNGKSKFFG